MHYGRPIRVLLKFGCLILVTVLPTEGVQGEWQEHPIRQGDGYWVDGKCGHIGAVVLDDNHILSVYGHYELGAAVLIKWKSSTDASTP